jgi:hypothetical protein
MNLINLAKKSAFFPGCLLLRFICDFVGFDARDLEKAIWNREFIWNQANKQIKGKFIDSI